MKKKAFASLISGVLIALALPLVVSAQTAGPSASGNYRFVLDDDLTKVLGFAASSDERGVTSGHMTYTDEAIHEDLDVDGTREESRDERVPFSMEANLDSLTIEHNRAVMSGIIRESSRQSYIGKWVQLIVEDNGSDRDNFTWRVCGLEGDGWTPRDAEDPRDEGAWWHWLATDAERRDDIGIPSRNIIPDRTRRCEVLPLSSYTFDDVKSGSGEIQVQP
jgi:hypothetical protein